MNKHDIENFMNEVRDFKKKLRFGSTDYIVVLSLVSFLALMLLGFVVS